MRAEQDDVQQRPADAMPAGLPPTSAEAMDAAAAQRSRISNWFYDVSPHMHRGLADIHVADERFTSHYEKVAPGLAVYVRDHPRQRRPYIARHECRPPASKNVRTRGSHQPLSVTSDVSVTPAVRPGADWYCQYRFVCAITLSGVGAPHAL